MRGVFRSLRYLRGYWKPAFGAFISLIIVNFANLAAPQLLRILIDSGITPLNMQVVLQVAGLLVVVALVRGLFFFLQGYWSEVASQGVAFDLRNQIFERLQHLSFSYHDRSQTGNLMTRLTSDVDITRNFVGSGLIQLLSGIILLIGTVTILLRMNPLLTRLFLLSVPAMGLIFAVAVRKFMPLARTVQEKLSALNAVLQENLAGIRVVKAFAREPYELSRFERQNQDYLAHNITLMKLFATFFPLVFFIANLALTAVIWVGGGQVIGGRMTLGELVAFIGYQGYLLLPVFMLGSIGTMMSWAEASSRRIFEVLDAESEVKEAPNAYPLPPVQGRVTFENVTFRYAGADQDALQSVSFEAQPNQTVAIMGRTGSGKSSIINLIPRFYDVREGAVKIDGIDVREVTLDSLRSQIGMVLQETTLFTGTIRENIAYGRPDASMEEIIAAARAAQAHEFISEMPDGYETLIGERGVGLSGGQRQRIAIARALILNPRILIMDDSTSSVDAETEYKIQQALENLARERTTFVIAQRISTVRRADKILLIDNGRLVAGGTHAELLECCELYVDILASQFGAREEVNAAVEEALK